MTAQGGRAKLSVETLVPTVRLGGSGLIAVPRTRFVMAKLRTLLVVAIATSLFGER